MWPRHWRLLVAVVVALAWLMQPAWSASQTASARVPDPQNIEPKSGPPGTRSVLDGNPCNPEEPVLVLFSELDNLGDPLSSGYAASTELILGDGGQISFVVPELTAGRYELVASCELEPDVPSVSFAVFTVIPDTATATQPAREPPGGALLLVVAAIAGGLSWHMRMRWGQRPERR